MKRFAVLLAFIFACLCLRAGEAVTLRVPKDKIGKPVLMGSRIVSVNKSYGKVFAPGQRSPFSVTSRFELSGSGELLFKNRPREAPNIIRIPRGRPLQDLVFPILEESEDAYVVSLEKAFFTYPEMVSLVPPKMLGGNAVEYNLIKTECTDEYLQVTGEYRYASGLKICANCFFLYLNENPVRGRYVNPNIVGYTNLFNNKDESLPVLTWKLYKGRVIRFYVDKAFPPEWFPYIKEGIEDWNKAFVQIGLGNVLEVLPEPDDDSFDPYSPLVNMVRFVDVEESNAKGDVLFDSRNGEILQADILWWKNVVKLLCGWRYVQTGAADPAARQLEYPIEMLGPMIRHAVCHEMGHALGLNHNMGASWAYPSAALRCPSFTRKYGTVASVMDYARYNHLATAADVKSGVQLLPPRLGPYDYYAIAAGYGSGDAVPGKYCYYAPFISAAISPDPSSQAETLGNDLLSSSAAGVRNCRALLKLDGLTPERLELLRKQYYHYIWLSLSNIGGVVQGKPVSRSVCNKTLTFVFSSLSSVPTQLIDKKAEKRILDELEGNFLPKRIEENKGMYELELYYERINTLKQKYNFNN